MPHVVSVAILTVALGLLGCRTSQLTSNGRTPGDCCRVAVPVDSVVPAPPAIPPIHDPSIERTRAAYFETAKPVDDEFVLPPTPGQ